MSTKLQHINMAENHNETIARVLQKNLLQNLFGYKTLSICIKNNKIFVSIKTNNILSIYNENKLNHICIKKCL